MDHHSSCKCVWQQNSSILLYLVTERDFLSALLLLVLLKQFFTKTQESLNAFNKSTSFALVLPSVKVKFPNT